ncbi:Kelch repeat-containing protein [Schlesneria paludicola]|uniref:Kelch repeat-containing protein n=1 Tax=Schlesneria paludicola TaxID=360056 RepID=UPI000299D267|nr:NHL repeat containing protein [Schlesneria paludicola]
MRQNAQPFSWLVIFICCLCVANGPVNAQIYGTWTDGDPQKTLRNVHVLGAASLLKDGRVVVAGGLDLTSATPTATTVAELYDPVKRQWTSAGALKVPRWSLDAVTLANGKVLFAGGSTGFKSDAAVDSAELFDPATGEFTSVESTLSIARQGYGISLLNDGRVILTGGNAAGNNLNGTGVTAVDIYDPATNRFQPAAPLHSGRALHAQLTLKDGRVVVIGGAQTDAEIYDPLKNIWTQSPAQLPTTLKDTKAFELYDGRIFIPGGQNTVDALTTDATWFFDVATRKFTAGPSLAGFNEAPSGVQVGTSDYSAWDLFPAGHALRGRYILIAGGEHDPLTGPDVELNSATIFDVAQNKFIRVGPMPYVHDDHTESALKMNDAGNPEFLLFGGNSSKGTSRVEFDAKALQVP